MRTVLAVPDISCEHCRLAITRAVEPIAGVTAVDVSVDEKRVAIEGEFSERDVAAAIAEAGYEVAGRV